MKPRGLRNNNPGNIRVSNNNWLGKIPNDKKRDKEFEEFVSMSYGYRVLMKNIRTYILRDKLYSVSKIIHRWAPPSDGNDTVIYVQKVSSMMGVHKHDYINPFSKETMCSLAAAISTIENGVPADMIEVEKGWELL